MNPNGVNRYKRDEDFPPIYEVHIYIKEYIEGANSKITIPLKEITKIDVYDRAVAANVASFVFTTIGVVGGVMVVVGIIAIASKSSCPFVYARDGQSITFLGEIYSGAIYPTLERDDYLLLPDNFGIKGTGELMITNELLEIQHTNLARLTSVVHDENCNILLDKQGSVHTLSAVQTAAQTVGVHASDYNNLLATKDQHSFLFNSPDQSDTAISNLDLFFNKPSGTKQGKLVLRAKNSYWLDYIYGKFNEQFGSYYNSFAAQQRKVPGSAHALWASNQGIPLAVSIKTKDGWKLVEQIDVVGPMAYKDLVVPVDLSTAENSENITIRLTCGFMFWELDYVAMDYSVDKEVVVVESNARSAADHLGRDISSELLKSDEQYLVQQKIGDRAFVCFETPLPAPGKRVTNFLHTRGYYEYLRDYKGIPNLFALNKFKEAGAFARFSKNTFLELSQDKEFLAQVWN